MIINVLKTLQPILIFWLGIYLVIGFALFVIVYFTNRSSFLEARMIEGNTEIDILIAKIFIKSMIFWPLYLKNKPKNEKEEKI